MSKALVIARREIAEKKFVFLTAVIGAILPFLTTLLPMARNWSAQGMVSMTASILATGLALSLAIVGGASMIGRELAERRLSFYFARPIGAGSIWFGKLGAALFIVIAAPVIVLAPALLFAGDQWRTFGGGQWQMIGGITLLSVLLLCASHLVSTFVRSRSVLIILDFVLAAAAGFAISMMVRPLWNGMAVQSISILTWVLIGAFVLAVFLGGAWQVADGRTDRKRSHAALSRGFWTVMGVVLIGSALWVTWVVSAKPSSIGMQTDIVPAKEGNWVLLSGQAPGRSDYFSGFVYDLSSGRYIRVSGIDLLWHNGTFTHDGKTAVIRQRLGGGRASQAELVLIPLAGNGKPMETGLITSWRAPLVVSDDAKRVAYVENGVFTVYDIPSKRSLASVRSAVIHEPLSMYFVSPDVLRIYSMNKQGREQQVWIFELDVRTKVINKTGELRTQAAGGLLTVSADGSKMLYRAFTKGDAAPEPLILADARTGARIMAVPRVEGAHISGATLLADGTVFAPTIRDGKVTARVFGSNGALLREIPLGAGARAFVAAELTGNRVVAGTTSDDVRQRSITYVIDVGSGRILRRTDKLGIYGGDFERDPRRGAPSAQQLLPAMTHDAVLSWDPLTGETKEIAKRVRDTRSRAELLNR